MLFKQDGKKYRYKCQHDLEITTNDEEKYIARKSITLTSAGDDWTAVEIDNHPFMCMELPIAKCIDYLERQILKQLQQLYEQGGALYRLAEAKVKQLTN